MTLTRAETANYLAEHDNYCILTHVRPDGDTLGSAAVLCRALRRLGKNAWVLKNSEVTPLFARYLHDLMTEAPREGDILVSVDVAAPGMLPPESAHLWEQVELRIDHHVGREAAFGHLQLVDAKAAACGEIIWDLLQELGVELDHAMAHALYVAVSTDTGCFRFANTTAHSYLTAAACAEVADDLYPVTRELFDTNSLSKLKIQSWVTENARFLAGGQVAVCAIPWEVEAQSKEDDLSNISSFLRSVEGVRMAAVIRQKAEGGVKVSVRAVPGYDASALCAGLGGGGHKGAAGASLQTSLRDAEELVARAMEELFRKEESK